MQLQVTVNVKPQDLTKLQGLLAQLSDEAPAATPVKTGKKAAKAPEPEATEEEETASDDAPATDEEETTFAMDEEETEAEAEAPKLTKKDLLAALKAGPKEKVTKLLQTKFKIKNINELKEDQYEAVIKAVKALK